MVPLSSLLAAVLLLSTAAHAQQAKAKRQTVRAPRTSPTDKFAFEQTYRYYLLEAQRAFLEKELMPEIGALAAFVTPLKEPELGNAGLKLEQLERTLRWAEYVQNGQPTSDSPALRESLVDQAADELALGPRLVEEIRSGIQRPEFDAISKACGPKTKGYTACLGRGAARELYLERTIVSVPDLRQWQDTRRAMLIKIGGTKPGLAADATRRAEIARRALGGELPLDAVAVTAPPLPIALDPSDPSGYQRLPQAGRTGVRSDLRTPRPPLEPEKLADGSFLARMSVKAAAALGTVGDCYAGVKDALRNAKLLLFTDSRRDSLYTYEAGNSAQDFKRYVAMHNKAVGDPMDAFVRKNPGLQKRTFVPLTEPRWALPLGAIVVWDAGVCGYNPEHGHIEIITSINPPKSSSDHTQSFNVDCFENRLRAHRFAGGRIAALSKERAPLEADRAALAEAREALLEERKIIKAAARSSTDKKSAASALVANQRALNKNQAELDRNKADLARNAAQTKQAETARDAPGITVFVIDRT